MYNIDNISIFDSFATPNALANAFKMHKELIVYPEGEVGENFLDFLRYTNHIVYFSCIATDKTKGNNTEQKFSHNLPVMPFEMLVHFFETALVIVAVPVDSHGEIRQKLTEAGFKNLLFLNDQMHVAIKKELERRAKIGQISNWFMKNVLL